MHVLGSGLVPASRESSNSLHQRTMTRVTNVQGMPLDLQPVLDLKPGTELNSQNPELRHFPMCGKGDQKGNQDG